MQERINARQIFKDIIAPFIPTYESIDLRAVIDLLQGQVLSLIGTLAPWPPEPLEEIEPIVQEIVFVRGGIPVNELEAFLNGYEKELIVLGDRALDTSKFVTPRFISLSSAWADFTVCWPELSDYRHFLISATGANINEITKPRELEAIARALGFKNFEELVFDRLKFRVGTSYNTRIELFAPLLANIEANLSERKLLLKVETHEKIDTEKLSISYRIEDRRGIRLAGEPVLLSDFTETYTRNYLVLENEISIPERSSSGEAILYHSQYGLGMEPISITRFTAPPLPGEANPTWDLVMSLIRNTRKWVKLGAKPEEAFRKWLGLGTERPNEGDIIQAIASLTFVCGLGTLSLPGSEGVDQVVLINEPRKVAVVLSYTTSPDIGQKIGGLLFQINKLKDQLKDYAVQPAILTPVERRDLRVGDVEECATKEINLILRSDLEALFETISAGDWKRTRELLIQVFTQEIPRLT